MSTDARTQISDQPAQERVTQHRPPPRPPFVGREGGLRQLRAAFDAADGGQGALVMLVGEPGIGKTALCEQLAGYAAASGGRSLFGHCYEEGSFKPPYQPFVEAFGTYVQQRMPEQLAEDLGTGAADLARIVPSLRERLHVTPPPPGNLEEDRWRLLQAATDLLHKIAAHQPLLLILEDLHDADRGTLDLLLYISHNLHGAPLLVVGTYRDVDVDRAHPLSAALAELHRASNVTRMHLRGLSTDEVLRLLAETSQQRVPQPFAELVHRQTEGNPLFVHETLRFVLEEAMVERRNGALRRVGQDSLAGRIPEGLRDAVGKRLSRLSGGTNRILSVASVIGREFQLNVLHQVIQPPEEELERALEAALATGIIEERSIVGTTITYRFSHAFFRQTLYDEIVAPRRIRLHQQVARALEEVHHRRLDEHAAELAEHYAFSSDTADLAKAVRYGELAARHASDVFAYGEAAHHLERALVVQDVADPDNKEKHCDLLLALGEALFPAGETEQAIAHMAPEALALADELGDRRRAFRACRLAIDCLDAQGAATSTARPEYLLWAERAIGYADRESIERSHADVALANALAGRRPQDARTLHLEALSLARRHHDAEALFKSTFYLIFSSPPQRWVERVQLSEESIGWPREHVSGRSLALVLWSSASIQLAGGNRARAEELWRDVEALAERTHVVTAILFVHQRDAIEAILNGRLEEAVEFVRRFVERAEELGASLRGRQFGVQMLLAPALHLGRVAAWLTAFQEYAATAGPFSKSPGLVAARATCLAQVGQLEEARALVEPLLDQVERSTSDDNLHIVGMAMLLQAAVAVGHVGAARALVARLGCVAHLSIGDWFYTCLARHLGDAAAFLGDPAGARAYYAQALEAAGKIRFRPEIALTHLSLAELLFEQGEESAASGHLDFATPELTEMRMQPAFERALALSARHPQARIHASARQTASDGLTTREREIAGLLAGGLSNRDIADRLVISEATVEVHVKHILSKLGFKSRSQVAGWVLRQ